VKTFKRCTKTDSSAKNNVITKIINFLKFTFDLNNMLLKMKIDRLFKGYTGQWRSFFKFVQNNHPCIVCSCYKIHSGNTFNYILLFLCNIFEYKLIESIRNCDNKYSSLRSTVACTY